MEEAIGEDRPPPDVIDCEVSPHALGRLLTYEQAWQHQAIPLGLLERRVTMGMVSPRDAEAVAAVRALVPCELDVVALDEGTYEKLYAAMYPSSVFNVHHPVRAERLTRALQEAGSMLSTSSEVIGWALLVVFVLAGIGVFYYFAQTLVMLVLHYLLSPVVIISCVVLLVGGFLMLRLLTRR